MLTDYAKAAVSISAAGSRIFSVGRGHRPRLQCRRAGECGKERGQVRAERVKREAILDNVRAITNYFRRMGRAALMDDVARADFDGVKGVAKKKAVVPSPAVEKESGNEQ